MSQEKLVGIIGWPVSHSLSPKMHNHAFKSLGLHFRYVYLPVKTSPETLIKEAVLGLKALGFAGANVTVPHKEAVLKLMDRVSDEASAIGAVNTIVIKDDVLVGHNTDALGFINDLGDQGIDPQLNALILGAGGSARAVAYGLLKHGAKVTILNRTESKALELKKALSQSFSADLIECAALDFKHMKKYAKADLIINTTSVGLSDPTAMPWDQKITLAKNQVVYDLIYGKKTRWLDFADQSGARAIDGQGMLLHQGALAFSLWTGLTAPVQVMKEGLLI